MAIQSASASLTAVTSIFPQTGFIDIKQGQFDPVSGYIKAINDSRWGARTGTTWSTWTNFNDNPLPIIWTMDEIDLGEVRRFTLSIQADFDGTIGYTIWTSDTGAFAGEETETVLVEGDQEIDAFSGRYVRVVARVTGREIRRISMEANNSTVEIFLQDVNTSTLGGTVNERQVAITRGISGVLEMAIHPKAATSYPVNLYVSDTATSQVLIPVVKSKGATPTFALYGIDNDARNGIVDISIKALPRQALIGGSLYVL
jgi:hypothetical protein